MATAKWKKDLPPIPKETIPKEKQEAFLKGVSEGKGIMKMRAELKITERVLKNTVEGDRDFADRYRIAKETPRETLEEIVLVQGQIDPEFAMTVLNRMDKLRGMAIKSREDREARKLAAAALGGHAGGDVQKIDLKNLTTEEIRDLKRLVDKAKAKRKAEDEGDGDDPA